MSPRATHQPDEAILELGQLLFELAVLGERAADGGAVALHALQDLPALLRLLAPQLCGPLQLQQPLLLLPIQAAQVVVVLHLGLELSSQVLQFLLQLLGLCLQPLLCL